MATFGRSIAVLAIVLSVGCGSFDEVYPPAERQLAVVGLGSERGQRIADSIHWYAGVRPDSVVADAGKLRVVLPAGALGHGARMMTVGCADWAPGMGAARTVAVQAWGQRDASIIRDTVDVVIGKSAVEIRKGATTRGCTAGPAVIQIDVSGERGAATS